MNINKIKIGLVLLVVAVAGSGFYFSQSTERPTLPTPSVKAAAVSQEDVSSLVTAASEETAATPIDLTALPLDALKWNRTGTVSWNGDFIIRGETLQIAPKTVTSFDILDRSIKAVSLDKNAVTSRIIKDGSVESSDLAHSLSIDKLTVEDSLTLGHGFLLTLSGDAAFDQNVRTTDTPLFGGVRTTNQNAFQINPFDTAAGNTGELRLYELAANGSNYAGFKSSDAISANIIWTLPDADGTANQVLTTNGSGVLAWQTASGSGTIAANSLDFAQLSDTLSLDAPTSINIGSVALSTIGTGNVSFGNSGAFAVAGNIDFNGTGTNDIAGTLNLSGNALTASAALTVTPASGSNMNINLSGSGDFAVNTNHLYVDTSQAFVGVGTATPSRKLDILEANSVPQLRLSKSGSVYTDVTVDSAGDLKIATTGGDIRAMAENLWICDNNGCPTITTPVMTGQGNVIVENAAVFGNDFSFKQIDATSLGGYDHAGDLVVIFDEQ